MDKWERETDRGLKEKPGRSERLKGGGRVEERREEIGQK